MSLEYQKNKQQITNAIRYLKHTLENLYALQQLMSDQEKARYNSKQNLKGERPYEKV